MNSFTLNFFDANMESQYQKEISQQRLIKLTRFMFLENFFLIIFEIQQLLVKEFCYVYLMILGLCTLLILIIVFLNRIKSHLLLHVLIVNYLGLIVFYIENIRFSSLELENSMGLENITIVFVIPFQVLQSMMIFVKCKWTRSSLFYLASLIYLFLRTMDTLKKNDTMTMIILSFCTGWIIHSFVAYDQEKNFKKFFKGMVESYEKVNYFKLILKNVIPSPIFIIDSEKSQIKFTNNSGNHIINPKKNDHNENASFEDLKNFLKRLSILPENPEIIDKPKKKQEDQEELTSLFNIYYNDIKKQPFLTNTSNEQEVDQYFQRINVWSSNFLEKGQDEETFFFTNNNPSKCYYEIKIIKVYWEESICLLLLFNDNTNAFRISELINRDLYKNQLLASVSHDLRTPLNGLNGMLELSISKTNDHEVKHYLDLAKKSSIFLNYLINDILDFSLMNFKKIRLNIEEINIEQIIENMIGLIEFQAKEKKIDFKFINFCKKQLHFYSDSTRIKQILINLLSNALKFTPKGSIQVILEDGTDHVEHPFYKISVKDTGIGIKKDDISKLYRLFGMLEDEGKMNKTGIGLGLTISKKISILLCPEKPEGLQVESDFGKGSTFYFFLSTLKKIEFSEVEDLENLEEKCTLKQPLGSFPTRFFDDTNSLMENSISNKKILVVDDDLMNLMVVEEYLKIFNIISIRAMNGLEAYKIMKNDLKMTKQEICMIIMDCNMPVLDGFKASQKIHKYCSKKGKGKIPIMALTANMTAADILLCKGSGMEYFLLKPMKKIQLKNMIEKMLNITINGKY